MNSSTISVGAATVPQPIGAGANWFQVGWTRIPPAPCMRAMRSRASVSVWPLAAYRGRTRPPHEAHDLTDHGNLPWSCLLDRKPGVRTPPGIDDAWECNHPQAAVRKPASASSSTSGGASTQSRVHRLRHMSRHEMRDELAGREDIPCRVLQSRSGMAQQSERNRRQLVSKYIEETERRRVGNAVGRAGRHPRWDAG